MNWPLVERNDEDRPRPPSLSALREYLAGSGWTLADSNERNTVWRKADFIAVLPDTENVQDYAERVYEALRTVAYSERRSIDEIVSDIRFGAADVIAARLVPDAPPGEAPLSLAFSATSALRSYVIGSGSALDNHSLVLPARRPPRAELYVSKVRFSTRPGSFILALSLPLLESFEEARSTGAGDQDSGEEEAPELKGAEIQEPLLELPPQPFGRRITNRMTAVAQYAQTLADQVQLWRRTSPCVRPTSARSGKRNRTRSSRCARWTG